MRKPFSRYELQKQLAKRQQELGACLEAVEEQRRLDLLGCIHWRDKAINRIDEKVQLIPLLGWGLAAAFALAAIAVALVVGYL